MEKNVAKESKAEDDDSTAHDATPHPLPLATFATPTDSSASFMHLAFPLLDSLPTDESSVIPSFVYVAGSPAGRLSPICMPGFLTPFPFKPQVLIDIGTPPTKSILDLLERGGKN